MRRWWAFAATLLASVPSRAETLVHDEMWIDIDATGACVVIPTNHDRANCEGVDVDAMRLKLATPSELPAVVFVGFVP